MPKNRATVYGCAGCALHRVSGQEDLRQPEPRIPEVLELPCKPTAGPTTGMTQPLRKGTSATVGKLIKQSFLKEMTVMSHAQGYATPFTGGNGKEHSKERK